MLDQATALEVLERLEIAVFEYDDAGFLLVVQEPAWLSEILVLPASGRIPIEDNFPFLAGFLDLATESGVRFVSDIWEQLDLAGCDRALRATALPVSGRELLLLEQPGAEYEERRLAVQRARERGLDNERLERGTREADRVAGEKAEFLAGISHDLRTPLNAMLGFSRVLLQERAGALNEKQRSYLGHVIQAATHLQDLVNDVLDLSRIEWGFLELHPEELSFGEVLEEILATLRPLAESKNIVLESWVAEVIFEADPVRFRQILYNLLSNAIKFTGEAGKVGISAEISGGDVHVSVSDTGLGIPPGKQEAVFRKFYQVRPSSLRDGSGLGLAITRRLVERHGGRIRVESKPGAGSRFVFTIPVRSDCRTRAPGAGSGDPPPP